MIVFSLYSTQQSLKKDSHEKCEPFLKTDFGHVLQGDFFFDAFFILYVYNLFLELFSKASNYFLEFMRQEQFKNNN